jgi:hypothetical protein
MSSLGLDSSLEQTMTWTVLPHLGQVGQVSWVALT